MYDVGGSITIFMFGGIMGTIVSFLLSFTRQKQYILNRENYTSSRFNATIALIGAAFFWVFFPTIFMDMPFNTTEGPFMSTNGMINCYYGISATVVTSLAFSAVLHGRIRIKDLMYAPFAGAAMVATSASHIFNPLGAMVLGMIAGLLQPLFNIIEEKSAKRPFYSTNVLFVFAIQGFLGSLAAGILRAIRDNADNFNYDLYPYPYRWDGAGEFYRATFISFGIAIGAGAVVALFVFLVSVQEIPDFYEDRAYWIVRDDGLRNRVGEVKSDD